MEIEHSKGWGLLNKTIAGIKALEQIKQSQDAFKVGLQNSATESYDVACGFLLFGPKMPGSFIFGLSLLTGSKVLFIRPRRVPCPGLWSNKQAEPQLKASGCYAAVSVPKSWCP